MSYISRDMLEISRCDVQFRTEMLAPLGLKSCHASYLTEICKCPGISQDKLAQKICINKSNVARQAVILEEQGFITRVPCQADKRVMMLYPTDKAMEVQPKIQEYLCEWESMITEDLTPGESVLLQELLDKLRCRASAWMEAH